MFDFFTPLSGPLVVFIVAIAIICIGLGILIGRLISKIQSLGENKAIRQDALKRSRSVILGESYEKIAPFMPQFPYHPKDCVFVGKGIDFVVFDGLANGRLKEVVFLEIKTAKSSLNSNERSIRDTVKRGNVRYEELRF